MESISKSALKARLLHYFRQVEETGEELIVTDNQRPVLRIVPVQNKIPPSQLFADVRGRVVYHEDPVTPTQGEWSKT
jgi:prevent-host-death family protein